MTNTLTPGTEPEAAVEPDDAASAAEHVASASRGLFLVAALLIIIPAAIGLYILRSGNTPAPPGADNEPAFSPALFDNPDVDEGPTSADMLLPGNATSGRIRYQLGDETENLANGGLVTLADNLVLQVVVSPFPPTEFDTDVELILTDAAGNPVTDATIEANWDMVMVHGPFQSSFEHTGNGTYRTSTFNFFMFGPWQLNTTVATPRDAATINLAIFVWPE